MHLKIILEIVTNLKSEKKFGICLYFFLPPIKQTNKQPKQQPPSNGFVEIFNFNKTCVFPHKTVLMKIILHGTIQKNYGVDKDKQSNLVIPLHAAV